MRVNSGADLQAVQMGGGLSGEVGVATATSATTLTSNSAVTHAANDLAGQKLVALTSGVVVEAIILSNTAGTNTVITVDRWVQPGNTVTATTPSSTTAYAILAGGVPARHIGLSTNGTAPSATDTTLTSELNSGGGGLNRAKATYSHTIGTATYTLTNTWTANSTDTGGGSVQIQKMAVFNSSVSVVGIMVFESAVPSPPTLVAGDTISITDTVNY